MRKDCEICGADIPPHRVGKQEICPKCAYRIECSNMANDPDFGADDPADAAKLSAMWSPDEVEDK